MLSVSKWGDHRKIRVGLLGGSFNPAHHGHLAVAERALRRLALDQVWLMVSPGNPLKPAEGMAPFASRLASAERLSSGRRIVATDIEARLGTRYTIKTVAELQRRFPNIEFVWLMGADGLSQLPRWRDWRGLAARVPIAVLPRPPYTLAALSGQATQVLKHDRRKDRASSVLARQKKRAWAFLPGPENGISATALRAQDSSVSMRGEGIAPSVQQERPPSPGSPRLTRRQSVVPLPPMPV